MENKPTVTQKGRYQLKYRDTECRNCGHQLSLTDKFCPNCSQANSTKKLSLKDYFDEFFSSLISYDSKLLKTLSALLLKPGRITKDYINGKRVSYTNPFRFLLSLAIIYFLIVNFTGDFSEWDKYGVEKESDVLNNLDDFEGMNVLVPNEEEENVEKKQATDSLGGGQELQELFKTLEKRDSLILVNPTTYFTSIENPAFLERIFKKQEFFNALIQLDSITTFEDAIVKYKVPDTFENQVAFDSINGYRKFRRQPGSFISMLISRLPFATFFFLPLFAAFIWLVYIRKKYNYTDHLIFSFHNTSLLFILLIISYLIDTLFDIESNGIFLTIFSVYLFQAMRKFYQQNVFKTIVKYVFLNTIFLILATCCTVILFAGNIFTY